MELRSHLQAHRLAIGLCEGAPLPNTLGTLLQCTSCGCAAVCRGSPSAPRLRWSCDRDPVECVRIFNTHLTPPLHSRCMERKRSQWARTFASTRAGAWPHIEVASAGNQTSLKFGLHTFASFVCSNAFAHCLAHSSFFGCLPLESYSSVGLREAAQDVGPFGVAGLLRQLHVVAISCSSLSHVCERGESLVI